MWSPSVRGAAYLSIIYPEAVRLHGGKERIISLNSTYENSLCTLIYELLANLYLHFASPILGILPITFAAKVVLTRTPGCLPQRVGRLGWPYQDQPTLGPPGSRPCWRSSLSAASRRAFTSTTSCSAFQAFHSASSALNSPMRFSYFSYSAL